MKLSEILAKHRRIAIVGGPLTGKTTLARKIDDQLARHKIMHTDDWMEHTWSEQPIAVIAYIYEHPNASGQFVLEGVQTARVLRKGLEVDAVICLWEPKVELTLEGQRRLTKGVKTVYDEWKATHPDVPEYGEPEDD